MSAKKAAPPLTAHDATWALTSVLAAFVLGHALQLGNGYASPTALGWLVVAFALPVLGLAFARRGALADACARLVTPTLAAGLVFQAAYLTAYPPAKYLQLTQVGDLWRLHLCVWALVALALVPKARLASWERLRWPAIVLLSCAMGVWLVHFSPTPHVDVFAYAKDAPQALLRGLNPYAMQFDDVYGQGRNAYAQGLSDGSKTLVGFPYLPVHLVVLVIGHVLGDPRLALHLLLVLAATLVATYGPCPRRARLAAVSMLLTPRCLMLLEQSFLEPLAIALTAAVAVAASRRPSWLPYLVGALLVTKQTMPLLAGVVLLLPQACASRRALATFAGKTFVAGCALTLPWVLWSPSAFWRSAVSAHFLQQQTRVPDSLTLATYVVHALQRPVPPLWWSLVFLAATTAWLLARSPRSGPACATGFGLAYLSFLLFAPQAYANYHQQVLASLFIGAGLFDFGPSEKVG